MQTPFVESVFQQRMLFITMFLLTAIEFLQNGMFAFAASPIMGETGMSPEEYGLVTVAYACVAIVTISKQRWIIERTGWRQYMLGSILIFITGAFMCAQSDTYHGFLFARIIMGMGGAAFMTASRVLVNLIPPSPRRFLGIKAFSGGLITGIAFAPWLAALAVTNDTYASLYYILIVIALVVMLFSLYSLPNSVPAKELRSQSHPFMLMLLTAGVFCLLWAFQRSRYDFFSDTLILLTVAVTGLSACYYFFRSIKRFNGHPFLMLETLISNKRFMVGIILYAVCYLVMGANNTVYPQFVQNALGFTWAAAGKWQTIGMLTIFVTWFTMDQIMPRRPSSKKFFVVGFLALAAYGFFMTRITPNANLIKDVLPALALNGVFLILVMATTAMQTFREVQDDETVFSHGQQVKNMIAQLCMALGIAFGTLLIQWKSTVHYAYLNTRLNTADQIYQSTTQQIMSAYDQYANSIDTQSAALSWVASSVKTQSLLLACIDYYWVVCILGITGATIMLKQNFMK